MNLRNHAHTIADIVLLCLLLLFLMTYLDVRYLFEDTTVTGGDTASWYGVAYHMLKDLLPDGRLTGWHMGNFCGYPSFSFYFIPPFLLAVLPSYVFGVPLTITLKLAMMSGIFLLPVMTYFGLRAFKYSFPIPIIGASVSLLFLFNESYTMFGGNTLSTFSGEFCYMFAFAMFAYFIGSLYEGIRGNSGEIKNGILLGLIGLSHLFVFIPATFLVIYWLFRSRNIRYLLKMCLVAFGLMAFWVLPLMAYRHPYTTPVYMIWQAFSGWRFTLVGIGVILVFIGPRLTLCAVGEAGSRPFWKSWDPAMLCFSGLSAFVFSYLIGQYMVLGEGLWATGLKVSGFSASPIGQDLAHLLSPVVVPACLVISMTVVAAGLSARRSRSRFKKFSLAAGSSCFLIGLALSCTGMYVIVCRSIVDQDLRSFFLNRLTAAAVLGSITLVAGWVLFFSGRFSNFITSISAGSRSDRFQMFLWLAFSCVAGYFSAHFLKVPDIRFLPPLLYVLILIFFADTLNVFFSQSTRKMRIAAGVAASYLCFLVVIFGASKSDVWFRYNNEGYEATPGYGEFIRANNYLKTVRQQAYADPLNAPRVAYEKCDMYGRYGGDRVFESLPFFSGRQTMEGVHYASSVASKFIAFLQTEYSRDVKTPKGYVLSRLNPEALPAHFDLYNISQLILMTDKAKSAVSSSVKFHKEAEFGAISIYRFKACQGQYVDVPKIRPVLYTGKNWIEDFYEWYKHPDQADILLVPKGFVKDEADRALFFNETKDTNDLSSFRRDVLDRTDINIKTHLENHHIRFTTNKVGLPHLVKVSYFPNWKVRGARAIYPVSPHLMLVIPRQKDVVLTYGANPWEKLGMGITAVTTVIMFVVWLLRFAGKRVHKPYITLTSQNQTGLGYHENAKDHEHTKKEFFAKRSTKLTTKKLGKTQVWIDWFGSVVERLIAKPIERVFTVLRPCMLVLIIVAALALIVGGAVLRNRPVRAYVEGYRAVKIATDLSKSRHPERSRAYYEKAIRIMSPIIAQRMSYDHRDVIHCMLYTAVAYERLGEGDRAEALYRKILSEYPYSRYVGEAYVKIARLAKHGRDQVLEDGLTKLSQGDSAQGNSLIKKALIQTRESLRYLNAAINEDPYSVWAEYAANDIRNEQDYLENKQPAILSLSDQQEIRELFD